MSLMALGAFLTAVGLGDLVRTGRVTAASRQVAAVVVGALVLGVFLRWASDSPARGAALMVALVLAHAGWVVASSAALADRPRPGHAWRAAALLSLTAGVAASLVGVRALEDWVLWPTVLRDTALAHWPAADVVVSAGAVLLQLATANLLVRLVLDTAGLPQAPVEDGARVGRVLGPLERVFIVGLGHLGLYTAAVVVVGVKVLAHVPELRARARAGERGVAERFVLGSFASWLVGLAGVALIYVA